MDKMPIFTRHEDGTITIDQFPETIMIAPRLIGASGKILTVMVHIKVANGEARYLVQDWDAGAEALRATRIA